MPWCILRYCKNNSRNTAKCKGITFHRHSSIDLYTTDGKKIDGPLELSDKTVYVAVEPNDSFLAGGYDQYLMKASKSWIKRYGDLQNINNNNKEKTDPHPETIPENKKIDNSVDEIEKMNESAKLITEASIANELLEEIGRKKSIQKSTQRTSPQRNALSPKQTDKKIKPLQRSSILRKNITNIQSNDKNPPLPLQNKRNIYENPKKILPQKIPQQFKTPWSSQTKSRRLTSQLTCDKSLSNSTYVTPTIIIPTKLDIKNDTQTESLKDEKKQVQEDFITSNDETKQENIILVKHESNQKDFGLETIIENINIIHNDELKSNGTESKIIEPLTSVRNVGDVINLRLSIEVKNKTDTPTKRKGNVTVTIPLTTNEPWNGSKEKSSQVNMDEMGTQMDIINVIEDCSKNDTTSKYIIFNCDCCHDFYHVPTKGRDENYHKLNYEVKNINNRDYILLLPSMRNDSDFSRCKCNDEPKVDKYVQTSLVIENVECLNIASNMKTVDQSNNADKTTFNVNNVAHRVSVASVSELKKSVTHDDPNNNNENQISNNKDHCPNDLQGNFTGNDKSTSTIKINTQCTDSSKGNDMNLNIVFPKDNQLSTEIYESANISNETALLDKSTQTYSHCFLLEARRQTDGHFSFHLPPLSMVKLYQM